MIEAKANGTPSGANRKARRATKRADFSPIADAMRHLGIKVDAEMSRHLGYSSGSVSTWRKRNQAPATAVLAAEALVRRQTQHYVPPTGQPTVLVALLDETKLAIIEPVLKGLGISYQKIL